MTPRKAAASMIRSFLRGEPHEHALEQLPPHLHELARTHARNTAALVVHHARRVRESPGYMNTLPHNFRGMVAEYNAAQRRKAKEASQ
jgi:hypothetical protein